MTLGKLRILHTNDLHSQLEQWPSVVAALKQQRKEAEDAGEDVLLMDIGDHCDRVHPMTEALLGKGNVQLLNDMNYDAVTIGNNEGITFSKKDLNALYDQADFSIILCNLRHEKGLRPSWSVPYKIYTLKTGVKIGVTGVTAPFRFFYEPLGWTLTDPFVELKHVINEVRPQVDVMVCLSHLGLGEDEKMAMEFTGIDIILGSHTHHVLPDGKYVNQTWINQSGRSGEYIGEVSLVFQQGSRSNIETKVESVKSLKVDSTQKDSGTEQKLNELFKAGNELLEVPVTRLEYPLKVDWYERSESPVLLSEALREWCKADISMVNSGVILDNLNAGNVTLGDLHRICPHPINPSTVIISGDRLLETIRQSQQSDMVNYALKGFGFRGKVLGYMIFDGVEILDHFRLISEKNVIINGVPLIRSKDYKLATLDMFTFGHLYPSISSLTEKEYYMPEFLRDVLAWKLKGLKNK
ncbi:bifunctional metallophosphatase/5'-nucleotidase [Salipaludibacillus sp. CF4.18]|uniref:bifunctional metallophosphatase/5'-nucleotidase n=1 Tax=Salipaludibacillus sp. CF4.18 TaxID=3373081 RepID=UPI003EE4D8FC